MRTPDPGKVASWAFHVGGHCSRFHSALPIHTGEHSRCRICPGTYTGGGCSVLSRVRLFVTPWTVALQAPLSTGFPRQESWSGLLFPPPGDLSDSGIKIIPPEPWGSPRQASCYLQPDVSSLTHRFTEQGCDAIMHVKRSGCCWVLTQSCLAIITIIIVSCSWPYRSFYILGQREEGPAADTSVHFSARPATPHGGSHSRQGCGPSLRRLHPLLQGQERGKEKRGERGPTAWQPPEGTSAFPG